LARITENLRSNGTKLQERFEKHPHWYQWGHDAVVSNGLYVASSATKEE